ncbi:cytochrome c family protein [Sandarakinorhabdus sp.]|uniref:c-type cytochrome n=1 Tax=Sandarakinorhabdus sp. TaxID=1916663 RepID=UPI00286E0377|nr:cytochrome c family protein [Sandarakinorhabdus sp.]
MVPAPLEEPDVDSFEWNKIFGAALAGFVALLGISIVTDGVYATHKPEKPGFIVEAAEEAPVEAAGPAEVQKPIAFYLASASAEKGEAVFKKCAACHNNEKGGANGIGPNLYGIVGSAHASKAGFSYSDALGAMKGKPWSWDELNAWLTSPKAYAAGNKMSFGGIAKPEDRAAVLAYLNSKSDSPMTLPAAPAEEVAEAPAEEAAAAPAAGQ